jgi:hypothetical protein
VASDQYSRIPTGVRNVLDARSRGRAMGTGVRTA